MVEVNKVGEKLLNCAKEAIIGKDFRTFIFEADRDYATIQLNKLLKDGFLSVREIRLQPINKKTCVIEFTSAKVATGDDNLLITVTNDITERNQLRSQAQLSERFAAVGTLAAGVAHEINNPIAWVHSNLLYLEDQLKNTTLYPINIKEMIEVVSESIQGTERVRDIVHSLKGLSSINEIQKTTTNINEVINDAINVVIHDIKMKARIEKNLDTSLPTLLLNKGKLHQVLLNIIINAAQAILNEDVLGNKIRLASTRDKNNIRIDITDTGSGISEENLSKIFDPFFTTKPVGVGTGLGLSICHEIITDFGGKINVKSKLGKGTTFSIYLPIQSEVSVPLEKIMPQAQRFIASKNILVIDDEINLLKSIQRMLRKTHQVTTALGGKAAIQQLENNKAMFDLIICDLSMPDITGEALYNYILEKFPGLEKKILFMSGGAFTPTLKNFVSKITNICLEKPFTKEILLQHIKDLVKEKSDYE